MTDIPRPPHAYVPGRTQRHPEGWFDPLKADVIEGMTEAVMERSLAWRAGVIYRAEGYFWECHEVLEALWLAAPDGPLRSYVQAVIQLANAQLKEKMGRPNAARRLCDIVLGHLEACEGQDLILGQPVDALRDEVQQLAARVQNAQ